MAEQKIPSNWTFPGLSTTIDHTPDWSALQTRFSWLRAMDGVPQSPIYHAEGDVLIHTHMVTEAMLALTEWREQSPDYQQVLYASAMLHDVGKPDCTVIDEDGQISSRGHAKKGEKMARRLLWLGEELSTPAPFALREQIARLVRLHGLPLQFLDKPDPVRTIIEASQYVRLDHVALLAEADVRGRICADQQELLDRVTLFREFCQEQACYTVPRAFASEHSRFTYLHSERGDPDYEAYDDTCCEVVILAGLPGVGKDTWIRANLPTWPVISLDALRKELDIRPAADQGYLIQVARERARELLRQQRSFVWNATNVTHIVRRRIIDLALAYHARTRLVYLDAPFADILSRNRTRQASVPEHIIYRMLGHLEIPNMHEAHRVEWMQNG
ncbi:MAG: AAA family ATPase [Ktedonobacteraceae bacterium]